MKLRFIRAVMVNGMQQVRRRSAQARLAKYRLFVKRTGPREVNITIKAAELPRKASVKISKDTLFVTHSASLITDEFDGKEKRDELMRVITERQMPTDIVQTMI